MLRIRFLFFTGLFSVILFLVRIDLMGQDTLAFSTEMLTVKDGLSQGLVSSILQDKDGLMWFGTKDGLNKYDGYSFTIYRNDPDDPFSFPGFYITNIVEDDRGYLWIGTVSKGLCLFDKKNEKFFKVKLHHENDSTYYNTISPLKYRQGKLTVLTDVIDIYDIRNIQPGNNQFIDLSNSIISFNGKTALPANRSVEQHFSLPSIQITDKVMWMRFNDSIYVVKLTTSGTYENIQVYPTTRFGMSGHDEFQIAQVPQKNQLLFADKNKVVVYDITNENIVKTILLNDDYPYVRKTVTDQFGNLIFNGKKCNFYIDIKNYSVRPLKGRIERGIVDRTGILWMGMSGEGILKYDYRKQLFKISDNPPSLFCSHNRSDELILDNQNNPEFFNLTTHKKRPVLCQGILKNNQLVKEFAEDKKGIYWMIILELYKDKRYLMSYNPATKQSRQSDLQHYSTLKISTRLFLDKDDDLWLCNLDKNNKPVLMKFNKKNLELTQVIPVPSKAQNLTDYFLSSFLQDRQGIFWFATLQGLYRFDPSNINKSDAWQIWTNKQGNKKSLSNDHLLSILPDPNLPDKYLWIGTEGGGVNRFEIATGIFTHYTDKDGLPNNVVYGLLNDNAGNIWMSTNKGLSCFNPQTKQFRNFTEDDGLPGNEFNRYEYFKLNNGDLFFGGIEGTVVFNPEKLLEKEKPAPVILTGLSVFNKPVSFKNNRDIIQQPVTYAQSITLSHENSMFSITYAILEYRNASQKKYKYILEGYDHQWIYAGNKNEATYTNLPPGNYTFHVTGAGATGVWNQKGASIRVIILPAWWQTLWFRSALVLVVAGSLYALYRYRLRQQTKLLNIRNRIASDLHDEIGSTLSSISISSTIIQNKMNGSDGEVKTLLNQISNNTDNMMEAMSDIVWTINTKNDRFTNIINRMRAFAIEILEPKDCMVHFNATNIPDDMKLDMVQRKNLYLIFKETIHNASKYSECKNVWIEITLKRNNKLVMKIKDDGKGFIPDIENGVNVFGGNGISNIQKRTRELSGKLNINAGINKGVEINLEFTI